MTTIYQAIAAVMSDVQAVKKQEVNKAQGFNFRGIDAVMNAVGPALREHGVIVVPEVISSEFSTVEIGVKRTMMGHVRLTVRYTFFGPEGDSITSVVAAEAMDSGDKATAKAMSVAFRTCLLQALCLPTDEPDPDHFVYERAVTGESDARADEWEERMAEATTTEALAEIAAEIREADISNPIRNRLLAAYQRASNLLIEV